MILINRTRKIVKPLFVPFGDGHGVSQNINIEAYDSTGGAGWEIDLNSDALEQASKDYTAAATAYSKALETMIKALKDLESEI